MGGRGLLLQETLDDQGSLHGFAIDDGGIKTFSMPPRFSQDKPAYLIFYLPGRSLMQRAIDFNHNFFIWKSKVDGHATDGVLRSRSKSYRLHGFKEPVFRYV